MALRALSGLLILLLAAVPAAACFGPKLFFGVPAGAEGEVVYALVSLYVQEKTGVESVRVELDAGAEPLRMLDEEKLDLALAGSDEDKVAPVLRVEGYPLLFAGVRPREELQFTTVLPAIAKLNALLRPEDLAQLRRKVEAGGSALGAARELFMQRRWI